MLRFIPENAMIQGGQKVYLCAESNDIERFEKVLIDDIRKVVPGAVLFSQDVHNPEYQYDFETIKQELHDMQLFVIPVTSAFLDTENNARLIEMAYAREERIPVLPILLEKGLENKFNELCGNLQCLDRVTVDDSAITYEKKLSDYLRLALVGESLSEQIKNAFDAYIFLSYRKKDRAAAQEVMRLIHENDFCRSFAIWYDEFLIPGEAFDASIQSALGRSKLFAMVMSSNMIEPLENGDPNYVMEYEYPAAVNKKEQDSNDKFILPVAVESISQETSDQFFPGIPKSVDKNKQDELTRALEEALSKYIKSHSEDEASHLYYMGMAYLNGVDVEVNRDLGIELLKKAADGGDEYAAGQLGWQFSESWEYSEAIKYYERYVEILKPTEKYESILKWGYENLIWLLIKERQLIKAEKYSDEAIACAQKYEQMDPAKAEYYLSSIYDMAGGICRDLKKYPKALSHYESALAIDEKRYADNREFSNVRSMCISWKSMAKICRTMGDFENARKYILKALDMMEGEMSKNPENYDVIEEAAIIYVEVAKQNPFDNWDRALEYALKALELYKKRIEMKDNRDNRFAINYAYSLLAEVYMVRKQYEEALENSNLRIDSLNELAPEGKNNDFYSLLLSAYKQKAKCLKYLTRYEEEIESLRMIHQIRVEHMSASNDPEVADDLAWSYNELAHLLKAKGPEYIQEAYAYQSEYFREKFKRDCNTIHYLIDDGDYSNAEEMCEKGIKDCEKLSGFTKEVEDYYKLVFMYYRKAELFTKRQDGKQDDAIAAEYYDKVIAAGEKYSIKSKEYDSLRANASIELINYYSRQKKYALARPLAEWLYDLRKKEYQDCSSETNLERFKTAFGLLLMSISGAHQEESVIKRVRSSVKNAKETFALSKDFSEATGLIARTQRNEKGEMVLVYEKI